MHNPDEKTPSRIKWRCRRGTRELDLLLSAFVDNHYHALSPAQRRLFDRLLESTDPQLSDWLCHGAKPADRGLSAIVERILSARLP